MKIKKSLSKCIAIGFTLYTLIGALEVIQSCSKKLTKSVEKMFKD